MPSTAERPRRALVALAFAIASSSAPAQACPSCAAGVEARGEVWSDEFFRHLLTVALPFLFVGAVSAEVRRIGRRR